MVAYSVVAYGSLLCTAAYCSLYLILWSVLFQVQVITVGLLYNKTHFLKKKLNTFVKISITFMERHRFTLLFRPIVHRYSTRGPVDRWVI